ncbi:MAG: tetraacyldisaccharide 4'-kinase [Pirellulales bacterium]|nr:tetraacyldisaccharide 4'-kinase [Pirellulales bacterium]
MNASDFYELASGRRRGVGASLTRAALRVAETPYALAMSWRNRRYDRGRAEMHRLSVPVVSVGNITMGGTGKTPMVAWLARWYRRDFIRVALVSRGYGATISRNDEALELEQLLPDVPHVQNADRVAASRMAIEEFETQLILLDDGFQHRRLARDLDIVLLDALEPFGFRHVFPRGILREPLSGLRRAGVLALSRADLVDAERRRAIKAEARRHAPDALWIECRHAPGGFRSAVGREASLDSLRGKRVGAFCGLGNPAGFRRTLELAGMEIAAWREFPDHHNYTRDDVESLRRWTASEQIEAVLCTHKDLVKIELDQLGAAPLWALSIGLEITEGLPELETRLAKLRPAPEDD